jgi:hypothetical protein
MKSHRQYPKRKKFSIYHILEKIKSKSEIVDVVQQARMDLSVFGAVVRPAVVIISG